MSYPLKKYSKLEFDTNINKHSLNCITAGALARIADSVELMAKTHIETQQDLEKFKNLYNESQKDKWNKIRQRDKHISNLRGQITKLKNKIEKLKNESK